MTGQVYALASGKGGVGKTTVTANLGVTLRAEGHSVALVDADLGMANLTTLLDVGADPALHDVLAGEATVEEALTEEASGFGVLPGTRELSGFAAADPDGLDGVLEALAEAYDFVLVDTGAGLGYEDLLPVEMADGIVLVTVPGEAAVGDTAKTRDLAARLGTEVVGVVVNRAFEDTDAEGIAADLGVDLLATIPEDRTVTESTRAGQPVKAYAPESSALESLEALAAVLARHAGVDGDDEPAPADATASAADTTASDATDSRTAAASSDGGGAGVEAPDGDGGGATPDSAGRTEEAGADESTAEDTDPHAADGEGGEGSDGSEGGEPEDGADEEGSGGLFGRFF